MIDFLKVLVLELAYIEKVLQNRLLQNAIITKKATHNEFNQATLIKEYKGVYFCFYTRKKALTKLEILIKPHYYFNNKLHNANDFKALDCIGVLKEIAMLFSIPCDLAAIINIEFGLNFLSPIGIRDFIVQVVAHEKNLFFNTNDSPYSKISYKMKPNGKANKYKQVKLYAKGLISIGFADENTGRFEVKSKQSNYINSLGIEKYSDLFKPEIYQTLASVLIEEQKKLLFCDLNNKLDNLSAKEVEKVKEYQNPISWDTYLNRSQNVFNNNKKKYFKLLDKTGENIHTQFEAVVRAKLDELLLGVPF